MPPPKLSSPDSTPRFQKRGEAKREKPIWTKEQFGPWQCDVRVTPITGIRRSGPVFEVNVQYACGPPLDKSLGPTPARGMAGSDVFIVDRQARDMMLTNAQAVELAVAIANYAAALLQEGILPDLPELARQLRRRLK